MVAVLQDERSTVFGETNYTQARQNLAALLDLRRRFGLSQP